MLLAWAQEWKSCWTCWRSERSMRWMPFADISILAAERRLAGLIQACQSTRGYTAKGLNSQVSPRENMCSCALVRGDRCWLAKANYSWCHCTAMTARSCHWVALLLESLPFPRHFGRVSHMWASVCMIRKEWYMFVDRTSCKWTTKNSPAFYMAKRASTLASWKALPTNGSGTCFAPVR